ncbi:MAG: hypothetical protein FWG75_01770 [Cystobacterineae bacterium]|nr:hypothetical protein [Cystobacterineae bacterium]
MKTFLFAMRARAFPNAFTTPKKQTQEKASSRHKNVAIAKNLSVVRVGESQSLPSPPARKKPSAFVVSCVWLFK